MNDDIKKAVTSASEGDPAAFYDAIDNVLMAKTADALKTKKMEISNRWLNDIEPPQED